MNNLNDRRCDKESGDTLLVQPPSDSVSAVEWQDCGQIIMTDDATRCLVTLSSVSLSVISLTTVKKDLLPS